MSLFEDREEIAAALTTVEGVTGYEKRPLAPKPGDGWPRITSVERGEQGFFLVSWEVLILLSPDEVIAYQQFEDTVAELHEALQRVGYVNSSSPVTTQPLPTGPTYHAILTTFIREF